MNAGGLTEEESDAEQKAARTACRDAARTPASGLAGLLAKADYIISEDAGVDADLALKELCDDVARMLKAKAETLAGVPPERDALMAIEDPIIDLECCLRLLQVLFAQDDPPPETLV